jgi:hypothetical protein
MMVCNGSRPDCTIWSFNFPWFCMVLLMSISSLFFLFEGGGLQLALSYNRSSWLHDALMIFISFASLFSNFMECKVCLWVLLIL